jgi:hypothetical protein
MTLAGFTYRLADLWIKTFTKVRFVGPITVDSPEYEAVIQFRTDQNEKRAPHLEHANQREIEERLRIDERSSHFAIAKSGVIVACVRITPAPFELSELSPVFAKRGSDFKDYLEFGRLCTDLRLERKALYASMLVVWAARASFADGKFQGVVAVCRTNRVSYMEKLGLEADPYSVTVEPRQSDYRFIHGSKDHLVNFYFDRLISFLYRRRARLGSSTEVSHESRSA